MENFQSPLHRNSRRTFTKSLMSSLAAAPLLSTFMSCRQTERLPAIKQCTSSLGTAPHEPPIGFSDSGSLILNVPASNEITVTTGSTPRPHKHTLGAAIYTSIQEVGVLTRPTDNKPPFFNLYRLPPNPTYQLRLWLVQLRDPSNEQQNNYEDLQPEPQLILKTTAPHIETERALGPKSLSHKKSVPLRYDYPPAARHFHIGKWQITDANGNIVEDVTTQRLFQGEGDDSYEIYISFNDPHL